MSGSAGDLIAQPSGSTLTRFTASTSWTAYPSSPGDRITKFIVDCDIDNVFSRRLWVAYSSGASDYIVLGPGDSLEEVPGDKTQIWIRAASSTCTGVIFLTFG